MPEGLCLVNTGLRAYSHSSTSWLCSVGADLKEEYLEEEDVSLDFP